MKDSSADPPLMWRWAFAIGRRVARAAPAAQRRSAQLVAWMTYLAARRRVAIIRANIDLCFPELDPESRARLVQANVRSMALGVIDTLSAWFAPDAAIAHRIDVRGLGPLRAALERGGALCLYAHFHSIELGGRALSLVLGRPMHQMVRRHNDARVEQVIDAARRSFCGKTIEKHQLADIVRSLREGHPVGYAPDQNFKRHIAFVPFFGQPAATLTTSARLARMTGVPVFCIWFIRNGERLELDIESFTPSGNDDDDAARWMAFLEARIRRTPEQYLWAHRRFKTRPDGSVVYPGTLLKPRDR